MSKKMFLASLMFVLLAISVNGQTQPTTVTTNPPSVEFATYFTKVVNANPQVRDFYRMEIGATYKLPDGSSKTLEAQDSQGIWGRERRDWQAKTATTTSPLVSTNESAWGIGEKILQFFENVYESVFFWPLLALLLILFLLLFLLRRRRLRRNPVTTGVPYIEGGIPPDQPARIEDFLGRQVRQEYATRTGIAASAVNARRNGGIVQGTIVGDGFVFSLEQKKPRRFHISSPLGAYEALYDLPDGTQQRLQCLVGCMNPVNYGGGQIFQGFEFTPLETVVPAVAAASTDPVTATEAQPSTTTGAQPLTTEEVTQPRQVAVHFHFTTQSETSH